MALTEKEKGQDGKKAVPPAKQAITRQAAASDADKGQARLRETVLLKKIRRLSAPRIAEVNAILDKMLASDGELQEKEAQALHEFGRSHRAFAQVWDNPDDAEYNSL
jgi:hypothetical protein